MPAKEEVRSCVCCSVETGSLIFAVINCLIAGVFTVLSFCLFLGLGITTMLMESRPSAGLVVTGLSLMVFVLAIISFCFSVVLVKGILKKQAHLVKTYFLYGIVVEVLSVGAGLSAGIMVGGDNRSEFFIAAVSVIGMSIVYTAILTMIWFTYKKFARKSNFDHIPFCNNYDNCNKIKC